MGQVIFVVHSLDSLIRSDEEGPIDIWIIFALLKAPGIIIKAGKIVVISRIYEPGLGITRSKGPSIHQGSPALPLSDPAEDFPGRFPKVSAINL